MTFSSLETLVPTSMYFPSITRYLLAYRDVSGLNLDTASVRIGIGETCHGLYATSTVARTFVASESAVAATPYEKPWYMYPIPAARGSGLQEPSLR